MEFIKIDPTDFVSSLQDSGLNKAWSCCGVWELGDLEEGKIEYHRYSSDYRSSKKASWREMSSAFNAWIRKEAPKSAGLVVAYLLPRQDKGDVGKLLRGAGFKAVSRFVNPNTHNTLTLYIKVLHPARRSRKVKSILGRKS